MKGIHASVHHDINNIIINAHNNKIPIGACCIAPVLLALTLRNHNIKITLGNKDQEHSKIVQQVTELGVQHITTDLTQIVIDEHNKLVTAPAYMINGKPNEIYDSIGKMVEAVLKL